MSRWVLVVPGAQSSHLKRTSPPASDDRYSAINALYRLHAFHSNPAKETFETCSVRMSAGLSSTCGSCYLCAYKAMQLVVEVELNDVVALIAWKTSCVPWHTDSIGSGDSRDSIYFMRW